MRELLAALTTAFGPPGAEAGVRTVIAEAVRPVVDRVWTDPLGNLLAERQGGAGPHTLLLAHLDEPGMVVTDVDGEGRAWVQALGPVDLAGFRGTRVVAEDGRRGVLTVAPERGREARREVWVDGGPGTSFRPGDVAVWDVAPVFQGGVCIGRALDGRAGCAVLVESLRRLREAVGRLTVAFCVQDHVGGKGAAAAAEAVRPDRMVAVDGAGADAEREGRPSAVRIGCGPSLRVYDDHIATH
ncbi:MAG: hypothetical protein IRY95_10405, partial [Clostridia bacterium]|nr:hypothetical protein [Clostridia bacterium]